MRITTTLLAFGLATVALLQTAQAQQAKYETGTIPDPVIAMPDGKPKSIVFLLSDKDGWSDKMKAEGERLRSNGSIVVGIDTPKYLKSLEADYKASTDEDNCIYTVSDIEDLSHQIQRQTGSNDYVLPLVAGVGEGGTLALAILAQTPNATIGETLAVDPGDVIPLPEQFCTPANKVVKDGGIVYGLTDGDLPDPATVRFSTTADPAGRAHVAELLKDHPDIDVSDTQKDAYTSLSNGIDDMIAATAKEAEPLGLPLTLLPVDKPKFDTLAIIYSGDGGWRDIDSEIGTNFQDEGLPVVGIDSLRYFWSERKPQETADDLVRVINTFTKRWKVKHVMLVGFSFGADITPPVYNLLPANVKAKISLVSLLSMSHASDFEISVTGWLGAKGAGKGGDPTKQVAKMPAGLVQCIYGIEDIDDDGCHTLDPTKVDIVKLDGGHHFDGDYDALSKILLDRLKTKKLD
ncbi:virulence factor family protein [Rhizobium oryziradicis]|uniref:Type IV secretory pathway protein AcvB n=1 Tax=Rhizobium oryziradicis TaxID=1867956 RepID=A0A1Q8ZM89_9HYPH|nr:AcvB/VirJ family lysyl-phosphatidylglycerol hydrolase [Rhizobium oryziradicis]OLP42900.1 type IV secretory pathway protein AcvB [Rhizobium oryziradicis]